MPDPPIFNNITKMIDFYSNQNDLHKVCLDKTATLISTFYIHKEKYGINYKDNKEAKKKSDKN